MSPRLQALCCECGELRTCTRPRNHREDNYFLRAPVNADWHRETGDLKCANCGRVTRHAIILPDGHWARNHAELLHELATGWINSRATDADCERIQDRWHRASRANPRLRHLWWTQSERKAREAGRSHMSAICGAQIPVPDRAPKPKKPKKKGDPGYNRDQLWAPEFIDSEEDERGWREVSCVDCLALSNQIAINEQREELQKKLLEYAGKLKSLDAVTVISLVEQFRAAEADQ